MSLPLDDYVDCTIRLPVKSGPGGDEWPTGTTATITFFDSGTKAVIGDPFEFSVSSTELFCKIEREDVANIPSGAVFRIVAVLPDTPTTEAPLYRGTVKKKA